MFSAVLACVRLTAPSQGVVRRKTCSTPSGPSTSHR